MDPAFPCINITSPTFVWRIFVEVWMRDIWFSWDFAFVSLAFSDEFRHNAALKKVVVDMHKFKCPRQIVALD